MSLVKIQDSGNLAVAVAVEAFVRIIEQDAFGVFFASPPRLAAFIA